MSSFSMLKETDIELLEELRQDLEDLFHRWAAKVREEVDGIDEEPDLKVRKFMPSELPFYMRRLQNFKDEVFDAFGSSGKSWIENGLLYLLTEISYLDISYSYLVQFLSKQSLWDLTYEASKCDHCDKLTFRSVTAEPTITPVSENFAFEERSEPSRDQYVHLYK